MNGSSMHWTTYIVAAVAVYGAVLSTYTALSKLRQGRRRIRVKFSWGALFQGPEVSPQMLFIIVSNPGNRAVTIHTPAIILPNDTRVVFPDPHSDVGFPCDLPEGQSCKVWIEVRELAEFLKSRGFSGKTKLVAICEDAVDNVYKSRSTIFDVDR
ncbi:hypothetical protein E3J62_08095 [candidate division TA06 bacterium]|uniref:Uncharacterized protein n=1 Tax=candidate division TA06 bacterium TaxID=2250710 RepID=A0A523URP0_UNCT6|nr:MAG: hypothetical protein E3J62_08095 [candidate division TA06 bacterium]